LIFSYARQRHQTLTHTIQGHGGLELVALDELVELVELEAGPPQVLLHELLVVRRLPALLDDLADLLESILGATRALGGRVLVHCSNCIVGLACLVRLAKLHDRNLGADRLDLLGHPDELVVELADPLPGVDLWLDSRGLVLG
jgi:hypothetical protein